MKNIITILFLILPFLLTAQDTPQVPSKHFHVGAGAGIDYGGFGIRGTYLPSESIGLFIGVGYNLNLVGYNVGAHYLLPISRHQLYVTGMYGYNGVIIIEGEMEDKATYYGFSGGIGFQLNSSKRPANFWNFELLVPIQNSNFKDDIDSLKALGVDIKEPLPIAISIGYHIRLGK